ncbi:MAG: hypothetical protein V4668_03225 [Patescibacteria group bacterium]
MLPKLFLGGLGIVLVGAWVIDLVGFDMPIWGYLIMLIVVLLCAVGWWYYDTDQDENVLVRMNRDSDLDKG